MALVHIDDLIAGMVLSEDLRTPAGRFVLAAGVTIEADQLPLLKSWGVIEARVDESSLGEEYHHRQAGMAVAQARARDYLTGRLVLNDLEQEPLTTLLRHLTQRLVRKAQAGRGADLLPEAESSAAVEPPPPVSMAQLLKGDVDLVSLPSVYARIVELLKLPDTSSAQLANVISKDASLTVRLLRLVNSPMYGFSGKIDSVSRAVSLLGTNELSTLALGISVLKKFRNISPDRLDMESFWAHSIRCGLFARVLAGQLGEREPEKYFTGGLLHDIGRLVMLERMPLQYASAVDTARRRRLPMYRAEQTQLNTDHSIVGKLLAEKWRLSPALKRMIGHHHSPRLAGYPLEACIVHIADMFAHACSDEILLVNEVPGLQLEAWRESGLSPVGIAPAIQQVDAEFKEIVGVFFAPSDRIEDAS